MPKLIPAEEKIRRARVLIEKARRLPRAEDAAGLFAYTAGVKDLLRQARDLVKFVAYQVGAAPEVKAGAAAVIEEAARAEEDLLRRPHDGA